MIFKIVAITMVRVLPSIVGSWLGLATPTPTHPSQLAKKEVG